MTITHLVIREISHRRLSFALSVAAVAAACACAAASLGLLRSFDLRTDTIVAQKEAQVKVQTDSLMEAYRRIGTKMGFNVLILPKEQNLADLYANDYAAHFMPESLVETLAASNIITIQHLLPTIQQKINWPERRRTIILVGTRGEVPLAFDAFPKKAMLEPVPAGKIVLGWELHNSMNLDVGDKVRLMGRPFEVMTCHPERGSKDDVTAWINLRQAQELLGKKGLINGIMALECNCAMGQIGKIREEIEKILPNTQVIEFATQALARAESRKKAADYAVEALENEKTNREKLRGEKKSFFSVLLPVVVMVCAVLAALLAFANVRERREEIGILAAVGWSGGRILMLIILRAFAAGIAGAVIGYAAGAVVAAAADRSMPIALLLQGKAVAAVLTGAPLLSIVASWLPALAAARQDPALVLRKE